MRKSEASKIVGWQMPPGGIDWPTQLDVNNAIANKDGVSILRWHRFLPSPQHLWQRQVLASIAQGFSVFEEG
jgi:hypothetical protein